MTSWLRRALILAAIALGLVAGALAWLAATEGALRWVVTQAVARSAGAVRAEDVSGSLLGPLRIGRLSYENPAFSLAARDVVLEWSLLSLTRNRLVLKRFEARTLEGEIRESAEPAVLPAHLQLPLVIDAQRVAIGSIHLQQNSATLVLTDVRFAYAGDSAAHHLNIEGVATPWGNVRGEARLAASHPFVLSGRIAAEIAIAAAPPVQFTLGLDGDLNQLSAKIGATGGSAQLDGDALFAPFDAAWLKHLNARATAINLAEFDRRLPATALVLDLTAIAEAGRIAGKLAVRNTSAGSLDTGRLPLTSLATSVAGDAEHLRFPGLALDLGDGGRYQGSAELSGGRLTLALRTRNLNLHGIHAALRPTSLAGTVSARQVGEGLGFGADLAQGRLRFDFEGLLVSDTLTVKRLTARSGSAALSAAGKLELTGTRRFESTGSLARFDPAEFGAFPQASINATFKASGDLAPRWLASLEFALGDSRLLQRTLGGKGKLVAAPDRVADVNVSLTLGRNRAAAQGDLGRAGDRLAIDIDAPRLEDGGAPFAGSLRAKGTLSGSFEFPGAALTLEARALALGGGERIASADARVNIGDGAERAVDLAVKVRGIAISKSELDAAGFTVRGTLAHHAIELTAKSKQVDLNASAEGGWRDSAAWGGVVKSLENKGAYPLRLERPVTLSLARRAVSLGAAAVTFADGHVRIDTLDWRDERLISSGSIANFPAAFLLARVAGLRAVESTLTLGGKWSLDAGERISAALELAREKGDLVIAGDRKFPLQLEQLALAARVTENRGRLDLEFKSARLGSGTGSAETVLERRDGRWGIAGSAPLRVQGRAALASLRPLASLADTALAVDGRVAFELQGDGTVAEPRLTGIIAGDDLRLEAPAYGVLWKTGRLRAKFTEHDLELTEFGFEGGRGRVSATGKTTLGPGKTAARIAWTAKQFGAVLRPDVQLTVSGSGTLALEERRLVVRGELKADQGAVELRSEVPELGADVEVAGRGRTRLRDAGAIQADVDFSLDLGPQFRVRGKGLDAQLAGRLALKGTGASLAADGTITLPRGTYEAYGQKLEIENGALHFKGPLDNPGINIRALRKHLAVEAGVELKGTARAPIIELVSNPEVPAGDKLSWLVLGRPLDPNNKNDLGMLQAAAAALLAQSTGSSASLQRQVARAIGLDEIGFAGTSGLDNQVVSLGKRLGDRLYVTYEQGLSTTTRVIRFNVNLTQRLTLRVEGSGTTSALDVFYAFSFD